MTVIDLFAGPGGFDLALTALGLDPLGIEWDDAACATREAAGLRTLRADVSELDPRAVLAGMCGRRPQHIGDCDAAEQCGNCDGTRHAPPLVGLCGGPPCPAFSMAGKGEGRDAMPFYVEAIDRMGRGEQIDRAEMDEACGDERAHLVLEPLRWALALAPRWIVLEQVPPVLPLWEATATVLRANGYATWTGILSAEQYGVPQTRKRAFLIASLDGPVSAPPATHARYVAPRRRDDEPEGLFAAPEPERIVVPEDRDLLPWVSMAEALGWGMTARPSVSLLAKTGGTGGHRPLEGGSGARETLRAAREDGHWVEGPAPAPAPTVTGGGGATGGVDVFASAAARERAANAVRFVANANANACVRDVDEPAPTITGSHDHGERRWELRAGTNANDTSRGADEPAPTIRFGARLNGAAGKTGNAVRVSLAEALVLQSFPPDYPVQGSKSKRFEQVGNAVPPLLAWHVLRAVIARPESAAA